MRLVGITMAMAAGLALGGCAAQTQSEQQAPPGLAGTAWTVERIGERTMQAPEPTIEFRADGRVGGKASCNSYGGTWRVEGARLTLGGMFSTRMACAAPLMAQEQALFAALGDGGRYAVEDGKMVFTGANGARIVARRS